MALWPFRTRKNGADRRKLLVVSHTHWDREWYLPFQEFRYQLVEAIDDLLDLLAEEPGYQHFTLDGQTIIVEDYLEARPERRAELAAHVQAGRLSIGPWYVLPDEFLVSGEALVRNLLQARRTAEGIGPLMAVGYLPDPFGHVAQLPQILRGFGVEAAVLWRGVGEEAGRSEFVWQALDGSEVLAIHLPQGYNNAAALAPLEDGLIGQIGRLASDLERRAAAGVLALMNGDDHARPQRDVARLLAGAAQRLRDAELTHAGLPDLVDAVRSGVERRRAVLTRIRGELRSARFAPILAGVLSTRIWIKQRNAAAQTLLERWAEPLGAIAQVFDPAGADRRHAFLRLAWKQLLQNHPHDSISGCGVDQVHEEMRARFDAVEQIGGRLLAETLPIAVRAGRATSADHGPNGSTGHEQVVRVFNPDPFPRTDLASAVVRLPGGAAPALVDERGEPALLSVQSVRPVTVLHEVLSRHQVQGLARLLGAAGVRDWTPGRIDALERLARVVLRGKLPRLAITSATVRPGDRPGLVVVEASGQASGRHDYEALGSALRRLSDLLDRPDVQLFDVRITRPGEAEVVFVARDVPPLGYRTYRVRTGPPRLGPAPAPSPQAADPAGPASAPAPPLDHADADVAIENEFYRVSADRADGTLVVEDRTTGVVLRGLNRFVDEGEAGDEYTHSTPALDEVVDRPVRPPVARVLRGSARSVLALECEWSVPRRLAEDRRARSSERVPLRIRTEVTLVPGVRRIDVRTEVDNSAADHRLRVVFPTGVQAAQVVAEGQFGVIRRPIEPELGGPGWAEQPSGAQPQTRWTDVSDGERGLLIGNRGLPELEPRREPEGVSLALTLLRCVGWLSRGDLPERPGNAGPPLETPGAQCPGRHVFEYCLVPHRGGWEQAHREAIAFSAPLRTLVDETDGSQASARSFLALRSETTVLSALKPAEDGRGLIVRLCNLASRPERAELSIGFPARAARRVRLDEAPLDEAEEEVLDPQRLDLTLKGGEILTLRIDPIPWMTGSPRQLIRQ